MPIAGSWLALRLRWLKANSYPLGKVIGRLDTLAAFVDEKHRRTMIDYAQGLAAPPLLQFIPIEAATSPIP